MMTPLWLEWLACLLALTGVAAFSHGRRWGWGVALAGSLVYCVFWATRGWPGQACLQALYAATQLWGLGRPETRFRRRPKLYAWLLLALPLGLALSRVWKPTDAWLTAWALGAQLMTSGGALECWRPWIVIDLLTALAYARDGVWSAALPMCGFAALAVSADRFWRKQDGEGGG